VTVIRFDPFGDPFRQLDRLTSQLLSGTRTPMGMAMDVWQADDGYHAVLDLPGVDASSVEITSERNVLTIAAERRPEYEQGQNVLIAERPQGRFTRRSYSAGLSVGGSHAPVVKSWRRASSLSSPHLVAVSR
jgi:HSP20 family protein